MERVHTAAQKVRYYCKECGESTEFLTTMFRNLFEAYRRWRHTRGYGVHSPFAYSVVKDVIRPGRSYGFYAYDDIDNALEGESKKRDRREARMLLRLAAFTGSRSAFLPSNSRNAFRAAITGACSGARVHSILAEAAGSDIVCSDRDYIPLETLLSITSRHRCVLALRRCPAEWRKPLFDAMDEGVMFYGKENVLLIPHPEMQKIAYSISV